MMAGGIVGGAVANPAYSIGWGVPCRLEVSGVAQSRESWRDAHHRLTIWGAIQHGAGVE